LFRDCSIIFKSDDLLLIFIPQDDIGLNNFSF